MGLTAPRDVPTGKRVLLFSGGMDSFAAAWILRPDVLLFLPHGQRYEDAEREAVFRLSFSSLPPCSELVTADVLSLGRYERTDAIVPLRNLLFVSVAAQYGETIYMGAMSGDRSLDKSARFFEESGDLLTYLLGEQHWCQGRDVRVLAPFLSETKTSLVRRHLESGGPIDGLLIGMSCYDPIQSIAGGSRHCGVCKPCFRKWVALENNRIYPATGYFAQDPWTAQWLPDVAAAVQAGTYRGKEDADWRLALAARGVGL